MDKQKLAEILVLQDGVITTKQALTCGLSVQAIQRRVSGKLWVRLAKGVYLADGHPRSHRTRLRTAVLSTGKDAATFGRSAAWWHGLSEDPPNLPTITIPTKRWIERTGADIRRRKLPEEDLTVVAGLAVTTVPLTVLESLDSVLMDRALQLRVSLRQLQIAHERNLPRGGAARAGVLLRVAADGGRSAAELRLHRIIRELPGWQPQFAVGPIHLDAAFVEAKLGIEVDGWRWHKDARRNSEDLRRQNYLVNLGWRILRYDWHRPDREPREVLAEIEAALKMQGTDR
ncbi:type IV toxin-antitoxin system AbiEi family antitoxin domain-containing protein [Smaragdicoccus niigatensis]|uniref:type IV toxin-antitoxin system AbiEi family antitoxin domain-containing protein n=1 Tax=Smaragdicoccus niigatensis TaxID=359359 RepID=UPI000368A470|nr:type IV toxin-antitoxin system AbiEi family antitoxin domain-containing protein [Smaragdicoccus niigatensis]